MIIRYCSPIVKFIIGPVKADIIIRTTTGIVIGKVYIGLYLRALRSDGVLNYEEKVWFADRVKELYDIDVFKPIQARYTREEFMELAKKAASAPLDMLKIVSYFEKEKKQELCYELA